MIAACPKCGARYRVDVSRLGPEGSRLRCSRCDAAFRVRPPATHASVPAAARRGSRASGQPVDPPGGANVVIADCDVECGQALASTLVAWGLRPVLVHDGVDAVLTVQRILPDLVILGADLPRMSSLEVCELIKRNASLQRIRVVLINGGQDPGRNGQSPELPELYGPDAHIGRPQLPAALRPLVNDLGLLADTTPVVSEHPPTAVDPAPRPPDSARPPSPVVAAPPSVPQVSPPLERPSAPPSALTGPVAPPAAPSPAAPAPVSPNRSETRDEIAEAERLARVIVADIVLYNEAKFDAAVATGNTVEALAAEISEGRAHFDRRIDAPVRETRDFLGDEILRVARSRGQS